MMKTCVGLNISPILFYLSFPVICFYFVCFVGVVCLGIFYFFKLFLKVISLPSMGLRLMTLMSGVMHSSD